MNIALIGYGEVGGIFGAALVPKVASVAAFDIRVTDEMREAAVTMRDAGLDPHMAAATAERQQWLADLGLGDVNDLDWRAIADRIER